MSNGIRLGVRQFGALDENELGLFVEAWCAMAAWSLRIRTGFLADTLFNDPAAVAVTPLTGDVDGEDAVVKSLEIAVLRSERYHFARSSCLLRSLTLHGLLKKRGMVPRVNIGVRRTDDGELTGHAWVTLKGRVLGDQDAFVNRYSILEDGHSIATAAKRLGVERQ